MGFWDQFGKGAAGSVGAGAQIGANAYAQRRREAAAAAEAEKDRALKEKLQSLTGGGFENLSPGQKAQDIAFGKEQAKFQTSGGEQLAGRQLQELRDISNELGKTDTASGPIIGLAPKGLRDIITPGGAAIQDRIESTIQENLKRILGSQFTEKEAKGFFARAYNPRLSEEENARRVEKVMGDLQAMGASRAEAQKHFAKRGTLQGYKPSKSEASPTQTMNDEQKRARLMELKKKYGR